MTADRYLLLLLRAVYRASRGQGDALLTRLAQQLAAGDAARARLRERCAHTCCPHALPGHRPPLARGADGRPEYEDYTY